MTTQNVKEKLLIELLSRRKSQSPEEKIDEAGQIVLRIDAVDSENAFRKVKNQIRMNNTATNYLTVFSRIAVVLFIPLLLSSLFLFYRVWFPTEKGTFAMQTITSPLGVRSKVVLPDGSDVWLNAESSIQFKVPFDSDLRNVILDGEAYFEVKKDKSRPFVVNAGELKLKVLGTSFNCNAYSVDSTINVVLVEGKVGFSTESSRKRKHHFIMAPGQHAIIDVDSHKTQIVSEEIEKYVAWHTGKLVFDESTMSEVALKLERWFGVDVIIEDPSILNSRVSTTFTNEPLQQVLDLLSLSLSIKTEYISASQTNGNIPKGKATVILSKKEN